MRGRRAQGAEIIAVSAKLEAELGELPEEDAAEYLAALGLPKLGADVVIGHSPRHLDDTDTFVFTTAINPRHEELVAARESGSWSCAGPPRGKTAGAAR